MIRKVVPELRNGMEKTAVGEFAEMGDGRNRVMDEEERVDPGDLTLMRRRRYEG